MTCSDVLSCLSEDIASLLVRKGVGRTPSWSCAWIYPVRSASDVQRASWLFGLAYDRIRGACDEDLVDRIAKQVGTQS